VAETTPNKGQIIIVSDLLCDRESFFRGLEMLRHRRHDVLVFHVLDTDEVEFPFAGTTRFEGMEELPDLLCDPRALRQGYLEALEEYLTDVRRGCSRRGIDYTLVRTSDYLDAVLSKFLHFRLAAQKGTGRVPAGG
jgi:glycine/D-amino acid oxidase-like deaminating enzyme